MRFNLPVIARSERDCSVLGRSGRGVLSAGWGWLVAAIAVIASTGCSSNPWLGPEIKHAGPLPDATTLINECIRAQGGSDAAGNITSAMHSGTVVVPQLGLSGTFTIWQRNPRMVAGLKAPKSVDLRLLNVLHGMSCWSRARDGREAGKGNQGVLATRNPMLASAISGGLASRLDERTPFVP
jgi:hypothetical protein